MFPFSFLFSSWEIPEWLTKELISSVLGYTSIGCWLCAQVPQVLENIRLESCEGLALPFLVNWLFGDMTNLLGCLLTDQLWFQTYLASYFCVVDMLLTSQYIVYTHRANARTKAAILASHKILRNGNGSPVRTTSTTISNRHRSYGSNSMHSGYVTDRQSQSTGQHGQIMDSSYHTIPGSGHSTNSYTSPEERVLVRSRSQGPSGFPLRLPPPASSSGSRHPSHSSAQNQNQTYGQHNQQSHSHSHSHSHGHGHSQYASGSQSGGVIGNVPLPPPYPSTSSLASIANGGTSSGGGGNQYHQRPQHRRNRTSGSQHLHNNNNNSNNSSQQLYPDGSLAALSEAAMDVVRAVEKVAERERSRSRRREASRIRQMGIAANVSISGSGTGSGSNAGGGGGGRVASGRKRRRKERPVDQSGLENVNENGEAGMMESFYSERSGTTTSDSEGVDHLGVGGGAGGGALTRSDSMTNSGILKSSFASSSGGGGGPPTSPTLEFGTMRGRAPRRVMLAPVLAEDEEGGHGEGDSGITERPGARSRSIERGQQAGLGLGHNLNQGQNQLQNPNSNSNANQLVPDGGGYTASASEEDEEARAVAAVWESRRQRSKSSSRSIHRGSNRGRAAAGVVFMGVWALFGLSGKVGGGFGGLSEIGKHHAHSGMDHPPQGNVISGAWTDGTRSSENWQSSSSPAISYTFVTEPSTPGEEPQPPPQPHYPEATTKRLIGRTSAWTCTTLYLTSRLPQIWKNYNRKSVEGLSILLFVFAFFGNLTYVASILINPAGSADPSETAHYLLEALPYLLGSGGTLVFDMTIMTQSLLYGSDPPIEPPGSVRPRHRSLSRHYQADEEGQPLLRERERSVSTDSVVLAGFRGRQEVASQRSRSRLRREFSSSGKDVRGNELDQVGEEQSRNDVTTTT